MTDATPALPNPMAHPLAWNLVADGYLEFIVPTFERYANDALDLVSVKRGERVLDVACGPGTLTLLAARRGASVDALDFAESMIEKVKARIGATAEGGITAVVGDGQALPYADSTFDAAFSMFGLFMFPDRHKGFRELRRTLKPGGRAVVASWAPMQEVPVMVAVFDAIRHALPDLPFGQHDAPLSNPDEVRSEMTAAGLEVVSVEARQYAMTAPDVDALWTSFEKSFAPFALLRQRLSTAQWEELACAGRRGVGAAIGEGPVAIGMTAYLGVAKRP